jgi:FAD/FMN-containing dehydrogenase
VSLPPDLRAALARELPADLLSDDAADLAEYGRDWTRVLAPAPSAIAFPRSTAEVSRVLALASAHGVPVVPSGGRTGLAGGAVAARGELVLSLARMRRMDPVDELGLTVRVQAGAVTEAVHHHVAERGLFWPVDFASKGSSQVGGNLATNAGGVRVIRHGLTRQWVLGLEVVLASGAVLELGGALEKNNTGLDLRQLFIGSEGTLGVITEATLKLCPLPREADVALLATADLAGVLALFRAARGSGLTVAAFEMFTDRCLARVLAHRKLRPPFTPPAAYHVLVELEGAGRDAVEDWVGGLVEEGLASDATVAQSPAQAAELWALREGISESLSATGTPHKNDVALPIAGLAAFCADLEGWLAREHPGWELCLFGHIGDGNLHVNTMKPEGMEKEAFLARTSEADRGLFELVRRHRGSISAEHGIGLLKKPYLAYSRSPEELELMRAVKRALDPKNILNPGKVIDP